MRRRRPISGLVLATSGLVVAVSGEKSEALLRRVGAGGGAGAAVCLVLFVPRREEEIS